METTRGTTIGAGTGRLGTSVGLIVAVLAACTLVLAAVGDTPLALLDTAISDVAVSRDGRWLAYSKRDPRDWYMDVWVARPTGRERRCLTCELAEPSKHRGNVTWHPSGDFVVFSAENEDVRTRKGDRLAEPGVGQNTNLWAMLADGSHVWKLTDDETDLVNPRGAVHPHFSPDGRRLCWAGPVNRSAVVKGAEWGEWALFLADIELPNGIPTLVNVRTLQPGAQHSYYEPGDWSPDGRRILLSANPDAGQSVSGLDICEYDIESGTLHRLTRSRREWDQFPRYSADGRRVLWASSRGLGVVVKSVEGFNWRKDLATELWIMNRDGSNARQLTRFNEAGSPESTWFLRKVGRARHVVVSDSAMLPGGERAAVTLSFVDPNGQWTGALALLSLVEPHEPQ